jgi:hypothetical protein
MLGSRDAKASPPSEPVVNAMVFLMRSRMSLKQKLVT